MEFDATVFLLWRAGRTADSRKRRRCMSQLAKAFVVGRAQKLARTPHLPGLDYRLFSESQFSEHFRFSSVEHVDELAAALGLPLRLTTPTGLVSTGRDALLLVLRRLCYSTRMITLAEEFGRSKGAVSALFNFTVEFLAERWADAFSWVTTAVCRLSACSCMPMQCNSSWG